MVLFPRSTASLQIFETRYRELLRDCMAGDRRFGIVLIKGDRDSGRSAEPFSVGTVAHITEIGTPRRGAIPIEVVGEARFRILQESRVRSYLSADVEVIEDDPDEMAPDDIRMSSHVATLRYLGTLLASQGVYKAGPRIPKNPLRLSYYMGMVATTARNRALQQVLEADGLGERMQAGVALLEEETDRLQTAVMRSGPGRERSLFSTN